MSSVERVTSRDVSETIDIGQRTCLKERVCVCGESESVSESQCSLECAVCVAVVLRVGAVEQGKQGRRNLGDGLQRQKSSESNQMTLLITDHKHSK